MIANYYMKKLMVANYKMNGNKDFYQKATIRLMRQIDTMNMSPGDRHAAKKLVLLFRNRFKDHDVKMATFGPDLNYDISKIDKIQ
mgnify:CR=1 FL=1